MLKSNKFTKFISTILYKRICLLAILSLLMTPLSFGQSVSQKLKENTVQNQIILKLKPSYKFNISTNKKSLGVQMIDQIAAKQGVYTIKQLGYSQPKTPKKNRPDFENIVILKYDNNIDIQKAIKDFEDSGIIEYAEPNGYIYGVGKFENESSGLAITPNDGWYGTQYWSENDGTFDLNPSYTTPPCVVDADIDLEEAWEYTTGGTNVKIAVLDTGFKMDHPEMTGRLIAGRDFVNNDNDPTDDHGHGTNVAGIATATGNNSIGHAGVNWVSPVLIIKVLDEENKGVLSNLVDGIIYAVDNDADVINLSISTTQNIAILQQAIEYAYSNDVFVAAAMGNENNGVPVFPAAYPEVISVGATDCDDKRVDATNTSWGSNYGGHIDLVSPGGWILGLRHDTNEYGFFRGGTSMAAPMVAGAASLLLSINPNLSIEELRGILRNTAEDQVGNPAEDAPGFDIYYGAGRMNVEAALSSITNCNIGALCDDNDACTIGETYDNNCVCNGGALLDNDNNGVCDLNEDCDVGAPCDDNNPCTIGETYDDNCDCNGGALLDNNNNGVCDLNEDCAMGAPCDDNDPCTIGEIYDDNCDCSGVLLDNNDNGVCDLDEGCDIGAPCDDNDACTTGEIYDENCDCSGGVLLDNNDNGVCDLDESCDIGAPCDDNDACTTGEIYDENCDCSGGVLLDNNDNGVCDLDESCDIGAPCDDNDACTIGEIYDENCDCSGVLLDNNDNGVCDLDEGCDIGAPCDDNDACTTGEIYDDNCDCSEGVLLDNNDNGVCDLDESCDIGAPCDDNDACTIGEIYDDNCNCVGTYIDSDNDDICDADDACPFDETNNCGGTPDYCDAYGSNSNFEYINRVIFADIDNTSGNDGGYGNYTEQVATVGLDDVVPISLTPGFSRNSYNEAWVVWIDFNQDGYYDSEEQIYSDASTGSLSGNVYIPTNATLGETGMRVTMQWNTPADTCEIFTYGEVEDYLVNITNTRQNYSPVDLRNEDNLIAAASVRISPNPATDFININLQGVRNNGSIKVVTLSGKTVMEQDIDAQTTDLNIAVDNLAAGMYLIRLNLGGDTYLTERFVKLSN